MIEQIGVALPFTAFYTTLGIGTTGLTVTVDIFRNGSIIVTAASAAEAGDGLYTYTLASGSNTVEGVYIAVFKTATATVDQQHLVAAWVIGTAGVENLDYSISSLNTYVAVFVAKSSEIAAAGGGAGAIDWHNQFIVTVSALPQDGVYVRFTTDSAGLNTVASGVTNTFGKLDALMLDAGTYYVWLQCSGFDFGTMPKTEVVA